MLLSAWAAVLVVVLFSGSRLYSVPLIAGTLMPLLLYASKNPRLFLLMGTVFTSVLGLSINFFQAVHMGGAPSFSIDLMDLFLLPLVVFLIRDRVIGYRRDFQLSAISAWWLGLTALGALTVLLGPFRQFAAFEVFRMLKCWVLFLVIANECVRERHFHHALVALAAGMLLNIVVAAAQFAVKRSLGLQALGEAAPDAVLGANLGVYLQAGTVYRVSALIAHPNVFSTYLAMLLPVLAALLFTDYRPHVKAALAALSLGGVVALLLTLSRTGWAAYAAATVCLMLFLYFHPDLRDRWVRLKGGILTGLGIAVLFSIGPIVTRLTASDPGALDFRYEWMGVAWKMVQAKPLLGFGLNSFSYQLEPYSPYGAARMIELFGPVWPVVHNTYFLVWTEQGTVGLLLFLGLSFHLLWLAWRNARIGISEKIRMLNIGAFCAFVALMVDGMGSFYLRIPAPARLFWILAGLVVASHYWNLRNLQWRRDQTGHAGGRPHTGGDDPPRF